MKSEISRRILDIYSKEPLNKRAAKWIIRVGNKPAAWLNSKVRQQMVNRDYLEKKAVKKGSQNEW